MNVSTNHKTFLKRLVMGLTIVSSPSFTPVYLLYLDTILFDMMHPDVFDSSMSVLDLIGVQLNKPPLGYTIVMNHWSQAHWDMYYILDEHLPF